MELRPIEQSVILYNSSDTHADDFANVNIYAMRANDSSITQSFPRAISESRTRAAYLHSRFQGHRQLI
jgi:hypothetical protein